MYQAMLRAALCRQSRPIRTSGRTGAAARNHGVSQSPRAPRRPDRNAPQARARPERGGGKTIDPPVGSRRCKDDPPSWLARRSGRTHQHRRCDTKPMR